MITIVNWTAYQQSEDDAHHTEHHAQHHSEAEDATRETPHQPPHAATPSKEVKNLNKKYTSNSDELDGASTKNPPRATSTGIDTAVRDWFEAEFWPMYPRREGKQSALQAANSKATTPEKRAFYLDRLKSQMPAYLQRKSEAGQRVIPMAATWFNQDRADDELEAPHPPDNRSGRAAAQSDYPEYVPLSRSAG
jgi:hypothetical protein